LGSSKKINRVRLFHPNSNDAPKAFTVQTSPNDADWTTQVTVAANTTKNRYTDHDFADVSCRYVMVDVTTVQTDGTGLKIGTMGVFCVNHHLQIKYGRATADDYAGSDDTKPMFELDSSHNGAWDYDDFFDLDYPNRAGAWSLIAFNQPPDAGYNRTYPTTQDGTWAALATVLGVAGKTTATTQFDDGYKLENPCGFSAVTHEGFTKQNPNYRRWRLMGLPALADWVEEYVNPDSTLSVWTAYGSEATTLSQTAYAIVFYHWMKNFSDSAMYAEATDVLVTIVDEPSVTLGAVGYYPSSQTIACKLANNTLSQAIYIEGMIESAQNLVVDCENFTVEEEDTGRARLNMIRMEADTVRHRWLELAAGSNTLEYTDTSVVGVTIEIDYRSRWL